MKRKHPLWTDRNIINGRARPCDDPDDWKNFPGAETWGTGEGSGWRPTVVHYPTMDFSHLSRGEELRSPDPM